MKRLTIADERIDEHTTRRHIIDVEAVRECAMEIYWRLKKIENILYAPDGTELISLDRLRELVEADRDGRCLVIPKEEHQPMFVKWDAVATFDKWNDTTRAIPEGTSWYGEAEAVIEEIAAMAFGAGIFYEAERRPEAEAALQEGGENEKRSVVHL